MMAGEIYPATPPDTYPTPGYRTGICRAAPLKSVPAVADVRHRPCCEGRSNMRRVLAVVAALAALVLGGGAGITGL